MQALEIDWAPLRDELNRWRRREMVLPVWWRDDDATKPSEALDQLISISDEFDMPVHLAVIPRDAGPSLAERIADNDKIIPVVHGWSHSNHQPEGENRCEFGDGRSVGDRKDEAAEALRRLQMVLGARTAPMFVPPWNRVPEDFVPHLAELGFRSLSTAYPRHQVQNAPGMRQINCHVDPLYWRPSRRLSEPQLIVERMVRLLKKRRKGKSDNTEPFGLLTHHLVHDERIWEFCRQYWQELRAGPIEPFRHAPV